MGKGTASYNFVNRNGSGLTLGASVNYFGNSVSDNSGDTILGGVNHGQNLCNGVTCPGAQF